MIMNVEYVSILKEIGMIYLKVLFEHSSVETEKNHETPQSLYLVILTQV